MHHQPLIACLRLSRLVLRRWSSERPNAVQVAVENISSLAPVRTSLAKGEIVEAITLPKRPAKSGDAYLRFIPRNGNGYRRCWCRS